MVAWFGWRALLVVHTWTASTACSWTRYCLKTHLRRLTFTPRHRVEVWVHRRGRVFNEVCPDLRAQVFTYVPHRLPCLSQMARGRGR